MADIVSEIRNELNAHGWFSQAAATTAANNRGNALLAILNLAETDRASDRRAWQLAYDIREAIADELGLR